MATQLHNRFSDEQIKELLSMYLKGKITRKYLQDLLKIKKSRFFVLIKKFKTNPNTFSIKYVRKIKTRKISKSIEKNIIKELSKDKKLILNKNIPVKKYNYSFIKDTLKEKYNQNVSLPTIINRAKTHGFYIPKKKSIVHDKEVITNYIGELVQHDSSFHLWAPLANEKWYLISTIDDYSRLILYAQFVKKETSFSHIFALKSVFLRFGLPMTFYVDSHSIFRFVQNRDSIWRKHTLLTDDIDTQWKQVLNDSNVNVTYALSPQAKGKIERSYAWIQDRIVRSCVRENVSDIKSAQILLDKEIFRYNHKQVHAITQEIPYYRFNNAFLNGKSLFRKFSIKSPFISHKDIFCIRHKRTIDAYRRISFFGLTFSVKGSPYDVIELRTYKINDTISEIRFWYKNNLIDVKKIKNSDIKGVHF